MFGSDINSGTISKTNYILYQLAAGQSSPLSLGTWSILSWYQKGCVFSLSLLLDHLSSRIDTTTVEIEPFVEKGVKLKLTVVDTPGFGDDVDNTDW